MTLHFFAKREKLPLEGVDVTVTHDRQHAKDCAECPQTDAKLDHITREIVLEGELSEEQRQKLLEIANKCPVHRTLTSQIVIQSKLAPSWAPRPWDAD